MGRANTMPRKKFMGPPPVTKEAPVLSDVEELARHMLQAGYRTAMRCTTDNFKRAVLRSDKTNADLWHKVGIWIGMLSD